MLVPAARLGWPSRSFGGARLEGFDGHGCGGLGPLFIAAAAGSAVVWRESALERGLLPQLARRGANCPSRGAQPCEAVWWRHGSALGRELLPRLGTGLRLGLWAVASKASG